MRYNSLENFHEYANNRSLRRSILISYLIGLPSGLSFSFFALYFSFKNLDEGLPIIGFISIYGIPFMGLFIAFFIALKIASRKAFSNLKQGKSILYTSFLYSLRVNLIIWGAFITTGLLFHVLSNIFFSSPFGDFLILTIPLILPIIIILPVSVFFTTFTIGFLVSYLINKQVFNL